LSNAHGKAVDVRVSAVLKPGIAVSENGGRSVEVRGDISYQDVVAGAMIRFHCRNELRCKIDNYFSSVKIF
jgi:hypothetical protein